MDKFDKDVVRHMGSKVTARQNGKIRSVTMREALLAKQTEVALKGSPYAIRYMLQMDQQTSEREALERREKREIWERIRLSQRRRLAAAEDRGEDPDLILPHPDDIEIEGDDVRVLGPCDAVELAACRATMKLRDLLYLQDGLEDRLRGPKTTESRGSDKPTSPLFLASILNQTVPKRFRLNRGEAIDAMWRAHTTLTKRELLKLCHRGWEDLGMHVPRGAQLPGLGTLLSYLDIGLSTMTLLRAAEGNQHEEAEAMNEAQQRILEELPLGEAAPVPQAIYRQRGIA